MGFRSSLHAWHFFTYFVFRTAHFTHCQPISAIVFSSGSKSSTLSSSHDDQSSPAPQESCFFIFSSPKPQLLESFFTIFGSISSSSSSLQSSNLSSYGTAVEKVALTFGSFGSTNS